MGVSVSMSWERWSVEDAISRRTTWRWRRSGRRRRRCDRRRRRIRNIFRRRRRRFFFGRRGFLDIDRSHTLDHLLDRIICEAGDEGVTESDMDEGNNDDRDDAIAAHLLVSISHSVASLHRSPRKRRGFWIPSLRPAVLA